MGKYTLILEPDYDFSLIGISSHEKDYKICWALNNALSIELKKVDSLEIKGKKTSTPSFFSSFKYEDTENFLEHFVFSNFSEGKSHATNLNTLFKESSGKSQTLENEWLIPEYKQMNYFYIIKGEVTDALLKEKIKKIKKLDAVQTAIFIDVKTLKSKHNLIF